MQYQVSILDSDDPQTEFELELEPTASAIELARAIAERLGAEEHDVLEALTGGDHAVDAARPLSQYANRRFILRRVCVDAHFEAEPPRKRLFAARARWERVHDWACRVFNVAPGLCANLELHLGEPGGPALNDKERIGEFKGCKIVWLVKPGAEPNGC